MSDNKCPCYQCICVPMCRHKPSGALFDECSLIAEYVKPDYKFPHIIRATKDEPHMWEVHRILNPTTWRYRRVEGNDNPRIIPVLQERI